MRVTHRTFLATVALVTGSLVLAGCGGKESTDPARGKNAKSFSLTIAANAVSGGKNAAEADWIKNWVIPHFVAEQKAKGVTAKVSFTPSGVDDEQFKTKLALDLKVGSGPDIMSLDGIWLGEFAQAGYIKPLSDTVGPSAAKWDGWAQIKKPLRALASFDNKLYGIPAGTDGRILYYNKKLFRQAGISEPWQPRSWQDILDAGRKLKGISGVTPLQINAGTAMGEATTMQGVLPLLAGAGGQVYAGGKWAGDTDQVKSVLNFYRSVYSTGLGDADIQNEVNGRDKSFQKFADGRIGVLAEGDYLWRGVLDPKTGTAPMASRGSDVGFALIPAEQPGKGVNGQDFVSLSGGAADVLNPRTKYPQQAWELLSFMHSAEAVKAEIAGAGVRITERDDVNSEALGNDPLLSFISDKVLPITTFRPGLAVYPQVSIALQEATADIVAGKSVESAAAKYRKNVEEAVGDSGNVAP